MTNFVIFTALVAFLVLLARFQAKREERLYAEQESRAPVPLEEPPPPSLEITDRDQVIGYYRNLPIYKFVTVKPNRLFVYESLAVKSDPNSYYVDFPSEKYMTVEGCFLYREIVFPEE